MFHFHMRLIFWNMHGTVTLGNIVNMGGGTLGNVVSIFLPYLCIFIDELKRVFRVWLFANESGT